MKSITTTSHTGPALWVNPTGQQNITMNQEIFINVKVKDIIFALKNHREAHISEYQEAIESYWTQLVSEMLFKWERLKADIDLRTDGITASIFSELQIPVDRTAEYDNQINMFEHSYKAGQTVIELGQSQFNQIVNDQFDWAVSAKFLNSTYTVAAST